jgi:hypothetical protein
MTRWGHVAYYLAAWLFSCLFLALATWLSLPSLPGFQGFQGFLFEYYFALLTCAISALLFAFVLLRVISLLPWRNLVVWIAVGAVLDFGILFGFGWLGRALESALYRHSLGNLLLFLALKGPLDFSRRALWLPAAVGAVTALLLSLFHRAFEPASQA